MKVGHLKVRIDRESGSERSLRPRFGNPKSSRSKNQPDHQRIAWMLRSKGGARKVKAKSRYRSLRVGRGASAGRSSQLNQRVVVKSRYVKTNSKAGKAKSRAHINYITRDSVGIDGGRAVAFNNEGSLDRKDLREFVQRGEDCPHQFRFIVSPENGAKLDMELFTKDFVTHMEKDLETKLDFVAVAHYDTDNPHVHIVVNGKTDKGEELRISRGYMSSGMRERAGMVATQYLGHRTEQEVEITLQKEISAERYTTLDRKIERLMDNSKSDVGQKKVADLSFIPKNASGIFLKNRNNLLARLATLENMGLAYEDKPGVWVVENDFREKLQGVARYNEKMQVISLSVNLPDIDQKVILDDKTPVAKEITGKVVAKGLSNELYDSKYMVVQATDGNVYYAPLARYSEKEGREARVGDFVTLDNRHPPATGAIEHNAVNIAAGNKGVYSLEYHRDLIITGAKVLPAGANREDYLAKHKQRLEQWQEKGFIRKVSENEWEIPKDLVQNIENKLNETRKLIVRVELESRLSLDEQVKLRGVTMLDRDLTSKVGLDSIDNSRGFKREFAEARLKRMETLKTMGLAREDNGKNIIDRNFRQALLDMEISDAAKDLSKTYGNYRDFDKMIPGDPVAKIKEFEGVLAKEIDLPSGRFAVIKKVDRFTIVPMQAGMEKLMRKDITITTRRDGKVNKLDKDQKLGRFKYSGFDRELSIGGLEI